MKSTRLHLNNLRRDGWDKLLDEVNEFCDMHEIDRVDYFNNVIDWLVQELDSRFSVTSSLVCSAAFSPRDSFHDFNVETLMNLAKLYPDDFSIEDYR